MGETNDREHTRDLVKVCVDALADKKGGDIRVIDISGVSVIADYFIIADGDNELQVRALADSVEEQMAKAGKPDPKTEGYQSAGWILLDYGDIVVHVFFRKERLFYDLERIWRDGKELSPAEI
jgi:ribosome-associated protein